MKIKSIKKMNLLSVLIAFSGALSIGVSSSCGVNINNTNGSNGDQNNTKDKNNGNGQNGGGDQNKAGYWSIPGVYSKAKVDPGKLLQDDKYWNLTSANKRYNDVPSNTKGPETHYYTSLSLSEGVWKYRSLDEWYETFDSRDVFNDKNHRYASGSPSDYHASGSWYSFYNSTNSKRTPKTGNNNNPLDAFYCGAPFRGTDKTFNLALAETTDGRPIPNRKNRDENSWEHVVPQSHSKKRWGDSDRRAKKAMGDIHCLRPALRNNGDEYSFNEKRSSYLFAILNSSPQTNVDFEYESHSYVEPKVNIRGDIARISFYMHDRYHVTYEKNYYKLLVLWAVLDPVTKEELSFDQKVKSKMGFSNDYITGKKQLPFVKDVIDHLKKFNLI